MNIIQNNGVPCVLGNMHMLDTEDGDIWMNKAGKLYSNKPHHFLEEWSSFHLYITSDEKGKRGCNYNFSTKRLDNLSCDYPKHSSEWNYCRKIIATTDPKLIADGVASIDQKFIQDYCKVGGISEVYVEAEDKGGRRQDMMNGHWISNWQLKLNSDHIIIHSKDSKLDIYAGELNTQRIKEYSKLSELYNLEETTIARIFCAGAEWGIDVALNSKK